MHPMLIHERFCPNCQCCLDPMYLRLVVRMQNSTACGQQASGTWDQGSIGSWGRNVHGLTWDASNPKSYSWNITLPKTLDVSTSFFVPILKAYPDRVESMQFNQTQVRVWALSTDTVSYTH